MRCKFCDTKEAKDFTVYGCEWICDDCMSILNGHMDDAFEELQEVYKMKCNSGEMWEYEFNEGLAEYAEYRIEEYNKTVRKEGNCVHDIERNSEQGKSIERPA